MKQPMKSKDDNIIISSEQYSGEDRPIYYCDNCHCTLVRLSDSNNQNESYYCNRCSIDYPDTTNIRQQLKVTVPDRNTESTNRTFPHYICQFLNIFHNRLHSLNNSTTGIIRHHYGLDLIA